MTVKSPLLRIACVRASRGGARLRIRYANIIDKIVRMDSIRPRAFYLFSSSADPKVNSTRVAVDAMCGSLTFER